MIEGRELSFFQFSVLFSCYCVCLPSFPYVYYICYVIRRRRLHKLVKLVSYPFCLYPQIKLLYTKVFLLCLGFNVDHVSGLSILDYPFLLCLGSNIVHVSGLSILDYPFLLCLGSNIVHVSGLSILDYPFRFFPTYMYYIYLATTYTSNALSLIVAFI
jgi:hypothetical protein